MQRKVCWAGTGRRSMIEWRFSGRSTNYKAQVFA
jgi:hypothetical protein